MTFKTLTEKNIPLYAIDALEFGKLHLPKRCSNVWELSKITPLIILDLSVIINIKETYVFDKSGNHWRFNVPFSKLYETFFTNISYRFQTWSDYLSIVSQNYFKEIPFVFGNQIYCQIKNTQGQRNGWINVNFSKEIYSFNEQLLLLFEITNSQKMHAFFVPSLTPEKIIQAFQLSDLYHQYYQEFTNKMAYLTPKPPLAPAKLSCFHDINLDNFEALPLNIQHIKDFNYFLSTYEYLQQIDSKINRKNSIYLSRYGFDSKSIQNAMTHYRYYQNHQYKNLRIKSLIK